MKIDDRRPFNSDGTPRQPTEPKRRNPGSRESSDEWLRLALIALGTLAGGLLFGALLWSMRSDEPMAPRALDRIDAMTYCQIAVKERLKAPSTADFPSAGTDAVQEFSGGRFSYRSYVDAENAFGAMIRTHYECEVEDAGAGRLRLVRLDFD